MASFTGQTSEPNEILTELFDKIESVEYLSSGTYGLGLKVVISSTGSSSSFLPAIFSSPTPTELYPIKTICLDNRTTVGALDIGDVKVLFVKLVPLMKSIKTIDELQNYMNQKLELYIESKGIIKTDKLRKIEKHLEGTDYTLIFEDDDRRRYYSFNFSEITYIGAGWDIKYVSKQLESSFDENFMKECKTQVKIYKATANNLSPICPAVYSSIVLEQETGANNYGTMLEIFKSKQRNIPGNFFDQLKVALNVNNMRSLGVLIMPCYRFPPMIGGWDYFQRFQGAFNDNQMLSKYFRITFYTDSVYDDKYVKNVLLGYDKMRTDKIQGLFYMVQIVSHMITMYKNGVIHGDLHLGNCLINKKEVCCKMPFNESGQTIDENSPFVGKVYIIDFGTAVELPTQSSSGTEVLTKDVLREMILNILTIKGSHSYSPLSHFVYDWFASLFLVRSKMNGRYLLNSERKPLIIEENITKMVELINEFMKSKMDFEEEMIAVKSSDQNFMSIIEGIRSINSSGDETSVLIGGRDNVPITYPSTIEGEVSIINPNKDSPQYINMEDPKEIQTQKEKSKIMTPELVNEIFRYSSDDLKEIGKDFIKSVEVGIQSVKDLKQTKDE
jgi:serine/threonine protein kinase